MGRAQQCRHWRSASCDENIGGEGYQLLCIAAHLGLVATSPSQFDMKVLTLDPPGACKSLKKGVEVGVSVGIIGIDSIKHADATHLGLLRTRGKRPRCRAADEHDELASFQLSELHVLPLIRGP